MARPYNKALPSDPRPGGAVAALVGSDARAPGAPAGAKDAKLAQAGPEVGPTPAFYRCAPAGVHGPTCIVWAGLRLRV